MSLFGKPFMPINTTSSGHPAISITETTPRQAMIAADTSSSDNESEGTAPSMPGLTDAEDELTGTTSTEEERDLRRFSEYLRRHAHADIGEVGATAEEEEFHDAAEDSDAESYYESSDQTEAFAAQQAAEQSSSDSEEDVASVLFHESLGVLSKGQK